MERPHPDRRQQIIDAAFRVFSRKGFKGASNREIAEEAGVAPGLIYWYFRNKEDLFLAVAEAKSPALPLGRLLADPGDAPPEQFFRSMAREIGRAFRSDATRDVARLLLADGLRHPRLRILWRERVLGPVFDGLTRYLAEQVERGRLRPVDPAMTARLFLGLMMSQVLLHLLLAPDGMAPGDGEAQANGADPGHSAEHDDGAELDDGAEPADGAPRPATQPPPAPLPGLLERALEQAADVFWRGVAPEQAAGRPSQAGS
ncbi:transcriptional regulator, TetR family [Thermaerobacter marianensis DSM 12885]|uniref:Transcriptional regulator, TetR family n=1 Tax=Thermaerobacter marianensis (strain ATCC 700841 / DSM 12885 / JCM 10246 / 7p75a) TaxID=644966 RepID=E6SI62_THEM7|nr:TetR/AcrR family transcriptional regulator [Thermaerobacter marianensis]ADU50840.1 transcriptional regulator, TetR family [Thermaerobacter marianensis DSM 12885]